MTELMIVRVQDGWRVLAADRLIGCFDYRVDAEEAALRHARKLGGPVRIAVQNRFGSLELLAA